MNFEINSRHKVRLHRPSSSCQARYNMGNFNLELWKFRFLISWTKYLLLKYGFCMKLLMNLWPVDNFFLTFWLVHSKASQKVRKKCSTGQRFICTKVTSYKIHILRFFVNLFCTTVYLTMALYLVWQHTVILEHFNIKE